MITVNDIDEKKPYTYKDIIEIEYPNIWELAHDCMKVLEQCQNMLVELLPIHKGLVPDYLKLRSLYALTGFIWERVNLYCHQMAYSDNNHDQSGIEENREKLSGVFDAFAGVDIIDIVEDGKTGFQKLEQAISGFGAGTDFYVLAGYRFSDIVGIVKYQGWNSDGLCTTVKEDTIPSGTNLGGFMDSEEDNKMIRIY